MSYRFLFFSISCLFVACRGDIWGRVPPHADFRVLNDNCEAPCKVAFINTSTGTANSYSWFFGVANSSAENPEQLFEEPGTYQIILGASNSAGFSSTNQSVTITQPHIKPIARFISSISTGSPCISPCLVNFENKTLGIDATYLWDFGDGITSTELSPPHSYSTAGLFTVTLTATNIYGTDAESKQIQVLPNFTQTKIRNITIQSLTSPLSSYDPNESYPHSCPDLYLNVSDYWAGNTIIQNRDINVLTDVTTLPVTVTNQDDKFLNCYDNYLLNISDNDSPANAALDGLFFSTYLIAGSFILFVQEITYPDSSKHWVANVPLSQFSASQGNLVLEYFE